MQHRDNTLTSLSLSLSLALTVSRPRYALTRLCITQKGAAPTCLLQYIPPPATDRGRGLGGACRMHRRLATCHTILRGAIAASVAASVVVVKDSVVALH